jgi:hypothetical protein
MNEHAEVYRAASSSRAFHQLRLDGIWREGFIVNPTRKVAD